MNSLKTVDKDLKLPKDPEEIKVLDVKVSMLQIPEVIKIMFAWIKNRNGCRYVTLTGMHGIMEAQYDEKVKKAYNEADLVLMDGMPLVWLARYHGFKHMKRRVYGPELMLTFCEAAKDNVKHFFYGGNEGVAQLLAEVLSKKFNSQCVGTLCPPFRTLTDEEIIETSKVINRSNADVLWIGISTPKQDLLMNRIQTLINVPVVLGIGAAFDFNAGLKKNAPKWIQDSGFEWLYRLLSEPKRLWRRYVILGPKFVYLVLKELTHSYFNMNRKK